MCTVAELKTESPNLLFWFILLHASWQTPQVLPCGWCRIRMRLLSSI